MSQDHTRKDLKEIIKKSSPLYEYWNSKQNDGDETNRLKKSLEGSEASILFREEPYKWEILFQSIIREVYKGDKDAVKGLKILIKMVEKEEQILIIERLSSHKLFEEDVIRELQKTVQYNTKTKKNRIRFLRILYAIFTNPYGINLKREKKHLYEHSGSALNSLRKWCVFWKA